VLEAARSRKPYCNSINNAVHVSVCASASKHFPQRAPCAPLRRFLRTSNTLNTWTTDPESGTRHGPPPHRPHLFQCPHAPGVFRQGEAHEATQESHHGVRGLWAKVATFATAFSNLPLLGVRFGGLVVDSRVSVWVSFVAFPPVGCFTLVPILCKFWERIPYFFGLSRLFLSKAFEVLPFENRPEVRLKPSDLSLRKQWRFSSLALRPRALNQRSRRFLQSRVGLVRKKNGGASCACEGNLGQHVDISTNQSRRAKVLSL